MKIEFITVPEHCAIIRNWHSQEELDQIWPEMEHLRKNFMLDAKNDLNGTASIDSEKIKKGKSLFIDMIYNTNRDASSILRFGRKLFDEELNDILSKECSYFQQILKSRRDTMLINYYDEGDEYRSHFDESLYTACTFLWHEPKSFEGGNFFLRDKQIEIENNMTVIFPGFVEHGAEKVSMIDKGENDLGMGRWSIAHFVTY